MHSTPGTTPPDCRRLPRQGGGRAAPSGSRRWRGHLSPARLGDQVEGLAQNNTSALNQLNTLADPAAALTQAQAQVQDLKVGTVVVVGVTERPADNVAPTVVDVDVNPARVGDLARVVVKMSEPVFVKADLSPPTLQITTSAAGAALVTATARFDAGLSSPDALVFTYRVQEGDARVAVADGAAIALPSGTVIRDLALNNANPAIATGASSPTRRCSRGSATYALTRSRTKVASSARSRGKRSQRSGRCIKSDM
jgi:hypothetical protein